MNSSIGIDVGHDYLSRIQACAPRKILRWAILFWDHGDLIVDIRFCKFETVDFETKKYNPMMRTQIDLVFRTGLA